ncbi:MAG: hypothetical protein LBB88_02605 [Planctomycetaceae bacterium]|nr:hypothetical protein [Planctomycetaceae bacterium]
MTIHYAEKFVARSDGVCCRCGCRKAVTSDNRFCLRCLRKIIRNSTPNPRTYIGSEQLDRCELDVRRFDCEIIDFDSDCSLGGRPNFDSWFPVIDEQY